MKIGVFDSGVGGLTVVRALRAAVPAADIVYLGDTARVPYGNKSPRTVERYALGCHAFLLGHGVDLVLIACNTASATALPALRAAHQTQVIGAVEPGADAAVRTTNTHHIAVIGTLGTVKTGAYERAIAERAPHMHVYSQACPLFVPLAEEGWTDDDIAAAVADRYLRDLLAASPKIDTLVLGCTHYPLLASTIAASARRVSGHDIALVDSAQAMAHATLPYVTAVMGAAGVSDATTASATGSVVTPAPTRGTGSLTCFATDISRIGDLAPRFLGEAATFTLVDL